MKIDYKKKIFEISFLSVFFMYFNFIPINIETQPIFIIALIPIAFFLYIKDKISISKKDMMLIFYIIIVSFYYFIDLLSNKQTFIDYLKLISGPISYLLILKNVQFIKIKHVKFIIYFMLLLFIIQFLKIPLFYTFLMRIYDSFFNRYSLFSSSSSRGIGILVPEPSYFMYFSILLLYTLDYIQIKTSENVKYLKIIIVIISLFTKSALVYLFLILYCFKYLKLNQLKSILCIACIIFFVFSLTWIFPNNRFSEVIRSIYINFQGGIIDAFFYSDDSSGFRFIINTIYYLSIGIHLFGFGIGGLKNSWYSVAEHFNIDVWRNGHFRYTYNSSALLDGQAYMANITGSVGIFSILLFAFFFQRNIFVMNKLQKNMYLVLIIFLVFTQSNLFNPVFWIITAYIDDLNKVKKVRENDISSHGNI